MRSSTMTDQIKLDEEIERARAQEHVRSVFYNWPITVKTIRKFIEGKNELKVPKGQNNK
jgi:hypothetical protein